MTKQKKKKGFRLQKEAKQYEPDFLSKTSNSCDMLFSDMVCANPVYDSQIIHVVHLPHLT